jgi:hypothetical protein
LLAQKPRDIFLRLEKLDPYHGEVSADFIAPIEAVKLAKKATEYNPNVNIDLHVKPDGFADIALEVTSPTDGPVVYKARELDLHDLSELQGSLFFGVDFGTSSTLVSFINLQDPSLIDVLPDRYRADETVIRRATNLQTRAISLMGTHPQPNDLLPTFVADYVYHSNRIEGSHLNRGETASVLKSNPEARLQTATVTVAKLAQQLSYVDEAARCGRSPDLLRMVSQR